MTAVETRRRKFFVALAAVVLIGPALAMADPVASPSPLTTVTASPSPALDCLEDPDVRQLFKAKVLTPEETTSVAVKYAKQILPKSKIEYVKPLELLCMHPDGNEYRWSLENLHAECNQEPSSRPEAFRRYAAFLIPESAPEKFTTDNVYPMIRTKDYVDHLAKESEGRSHMVNRPFLNELRIVYAFDSAGKFQLVTADKLSDLGITASALHNAALRNLSTKTREIELSDAGAIWSASVGGNFESSLILDDWVVRKLAAHVKGELLVTIPSRDSLFFTGSQVPDGVATLNHLTQVEFSRGHHPISTYILRRVGTNWEVFRH